MANRAPRGPRGGRGSRGGESSSRGGSSRGRGRGGRDDNNNQSPNACSGCGHTNHDESRCWKLHPGLKPEKFRDSQQNNKQQSQKRSRDTDEGYRSSNACPHCGRPNHDESRCWVLHPGLKPDFSKSQQNRPSKEQQQQQIRDTSDGHQSPQKTVDTVTDESSWNASSTITINPRSEWDWGGHPISEGNGKPITWSWTTLFDMYVFSIEFDAKGVHDASLEIIQIKRCQRRPVQYDFPTPALYHTISNNPKLKNTPLDRMLSIWHSRYNITRREGDPDNGESYPVWFTGEDGDLARKQREARACEKCHDQKAVCKATTHTKDDEVMDLRHLWCYYHDHAGHEKVRCLQRFDEMDGEGRFRDGKGVVKDG